MSATTTYDINVRYKLEDRASKGAAKIGTELQKTSRHGRSLLSTMKIVAAGAAVGFGFRAGKKWLIDYNSSLQDMKLAMTGLIQLNLGGKWADSQSKANGLIEVFKKDAEASAGTMQDFASFSQLIVGPVTRAKMSMKDLRDLTKGGVVAAKAFGIESEVAARDIEQALAGTLGMKDRFARAILEPMGISTTAWNKLMKETPQKAARTLVAAFNQPALKKMAEGFKNTWSGVTSTIKDRLQQALGKVGLPLMEALTSEVKEMSSYFENSPRKVEQFITRAGKALVDGFGMVKDVIKFLADNSGTLLSIAKAFIGFKLIRGAGGLLAGPFDMLSRYSMAQKSAMVATTSFAASMTAAGNKIQGVGTMLAAVYMGSKLVADYIDRHQDKYIENIAKKPQGLLFSATEKNQTGERASRTVALAKYGSDKSLLKDSGEADIGKFFSSVTGRNITEESLKKKFENYKSNPTVIQRRKNASLASYRETGKSLPAMTMENTDFLQGVGGMNREDGKRAKEAWIGLISALESDRAKNAKMLKDNLTETFREMVQFMKQGGNFNFWNKAAGFAADGVSMGAFNAVTGEGEYRQQAQAERATKKNGDVNIHINTIKVAADNPDRFAIRLIGAFKKATTKPVASRLSSAIGGRPR